MQPRDNQKNRSSFRRGQQDRPQDNFSRSSQDVARWSNEGGRPKQNYSRTDNDDFSSYDREGRYDRSERSQYAGSQSQYDRQNTSGWGHDSSPNDESDYRSRYQGFSDRDSEEDRYGYRQDLGRHRGSDHDEHQHRRQGTNQDYRTPSDRYSQSEYGRGTTMDDTSIRDYDMTRGSRREGGYNTSRYPETGFSSSESSSRSWSGDTERGPYNYGSTRNEWSSGRSGQYSGKGPKGFKRSDDRIKEDISEILTRHPEIDGSEIEIDVKEGDVTLSGVVPERSMKHLTEDIVERCMGVRDITNQLRVKREGESESEAVYGTSSSKSKKTSGSSTTPTSGSH